MTVNDDKLRTIALHEDGWRVTIIDQTRLPGQLHRVVLDSLELAARAIAEMWVRGAPLIGATAAYGLALAMRHDSSDASLASACDSLLATRPTAVNLRWSVEAGRDTLSPLAPPERELRAYQFANALAEADVETNAAIGRHGAHILQGMARHSPAGRPINILTHCNAGWLATVGWGTALAPIYAAQMQGIDCHVWVDETRPRNQGAHLTAWELDNAGVAHTVIVDNAGGHLMQRGDVDICIVGSDRTAANGDVCNKIGTYLKALAARDNNIPFYVALPSSTVDWQCNSGRDIPIEHRAPDEVTHVEGIAEAGETVRVRTVHARSKVSNPAFDVTPAACVSGLITERGVCAASREGLQSLFPEHA